MKELLKYKEYQASVQFDAVAQVFHGRILGIKDLVNFEGKTPEGLEKTFAKAVEDYLKICKVVGREPDKA
jgi:predicted HicB family RNase H-like nuclease